MGKNKNSQQLGSSFGLNSKMKMFFTKPENEKTVVFAEYNTTGAGASITKRVLWSIRLLEKDAAEYNKENIFLPLSWEIPTARKWYAIDL